MLGSTPDPLGGSIGQVLATTAQVEPGSSGSPTLNEAGQVVLAYRIYRCWVSDYQALPELDASANAIAIQSITLQHEGWERDYEVTEPTEPSFTEPPA